MAETPGLSSAGAAGLSAHEAAGLSAAEAARRLAAEGPNSLPSTDRRSGAAIVLGVLREPMFALLVAAAGVYLLLGDLREALVLAASIVVVMAITVVQERKAERALEALRDLSSPRALVVRDGAVRRIAGSAVARGDLLLLAEGDRVPADARLVQANELTLNESMLTGESLPVEKRDGLVYSGTLVVRGQGRAEVVATGARTELGRIGTSLAALSPEKTRLERETARIVRVVATFAVLLSLLLCAYYGLARGEWLTGVLAGLTLAMAILPEEFPVVLMVFLALGAWRISRQGVLTRRMPAIETLGSATVLCVDKTGTLTENQMAVADVIGEDASRVSDIAALACELEPFDPMERAILAAAAPQVTAMRRAWSLERDYPMSGAFLAVCHVWRSASGERRVAIKGAAETVLPLCGMDPAAQGAQAMVDDAAARGLRLLAVAEAGWAEGPLPEHPAAFRFRWLGYVALADPLRAEVPPAVAMCRQAGIRVVMITGDYAGTAIAIAEQAGIDSAGGVLTGTQIDALDDAALAGAARRVSLFARILPQQKLRLVQAFKAAGEIVAMTGDGVNDAPALKAAHIGVAMGQRGTDVAREAAALVLLEDNFGAIVATVRLGRRIYENIRNAMRYLIAVHVPTAGMSFLPLAFGWPVLFYPVHIVFLEFIIDPACSIVFEAEHSEDGIMQRPPRPPAEPLFSARMLAISLGLGLSMLVAVGLAYAWAAASGRADGQVRALGFATVVFGNLALILATRSRERTLLAALARPNPALWWIVGGTLAALAGALYVPAAASLFRFAPLGALELAVALGAALLGVLWFEALKVARRR